jgi:murein DD-endopeptidase MepM/ murein hydrolase activator NlpD
MSRSVAGGIALVVIPFTANSAMANSSNADIAAPLRAAQEAKQNAQSGDSEFKQLFSSWRQLDKSAGFAASMPSPAFGLVQPAPSINKVSIPSRNPVDGVTFTSGFGMRYHPILHQRRAHKGIDLAAPVGTPVYAPADGMVGKAEWFSSYGLYIALEHGAEIETRYGHLSRLNVSAGQQVHKGDLIGFVGTTGRSTGPHLHYEVRIDGVAVNPIPYLQVDQLHQRQGSGTTLAMHVDEND